MSRIPTSVMPHAIDREAAATPAEPRRRGPVRQAFRLVTAPPVMALGLAAMAIERLRRRPAPG